MPSEDKRSDEELAVDARTHVESFELLVLRFQGKLLRYIKQRVGDVRVAEEIVQDAFIRAYRNLHRYNPDYHFSTWLYTIASRLAASWYRSSKRTTQTEFLPTDEADYRTAYGEIAKEERREEIWSVARQVLKEQAFNILILRYQEEHSIAAVARISGLTEVHVKVTLHRARKKLAVHLRNQI